MPLILLRFATEVLFPYFFKSLVSASGLSSGDSPGGVLVPGVRPRGFSPGVSPGTGAFGR